MDKRTHEADEDEIILGAFVEKQTEPLGDDPYGTREEQAERKRSVGRPAYEPTDRERAIVTRMASRMCTTADIAEALGISDVTVEKYFLADIQLARGAAKESLRASQFRRAHQGSDAQLKWLGMQYLGQKDKIESEVTKRDFVIDDNDDSPTAKTNATPTDSDGDSDTV